MDASHRVHARAPAPADGADCGSGAPPPRPVAGVFAAGDAATPSLLPPGWHPHWHPMRLWRAAREGGAAAGRAMLRLALEPPASASADAAADDERDDADASSLRLFAHATTFFGLRVVLLGRYNGQGLAPADGDRLVSYCRSDPAGSGSGGGDDEGPYFARLTLLDGRLVGAVLLGGGAAAMAEACEHLILDRLDVAALGPRLLDPDFDLEDFFD